MAWMRYSVLLAVMSIFMCTATAQTEPHTRISEDDATRIKAAETSFFSEEDAKKLARDMKEYVDDEGECVAPPGSVETCYAVKKPSVWTDGDCCCPTVPRYYFPRRFYRFGRWWYPLRIFNVNQWVKGGKCLSFGTCHVDKSVMPWEHRRCVQQYEWKGFLVYSLSGTLGDFQIRYMYFPIPDYCSCPHCRTKICSVKPDSVISKILI